MIFFFILETHILTSSTIVRSIIKLSFKHCYLVGYEQLVGISDDRSLAKTHIEVLVVLQHEPVHGQRVLAS